MMDTPIRLSEGKCQKMMDCSWCGDEMKENMLHICIESWSCHACGATTTNPEESLIVYSHEDCPNKNCP